MTKIRDEAKLAGLAEGDAHVIRTTTPTAAWSCSPTT